MSRNPRPLVTRLRAARMLLQEWRRTLRDSEVERGGDHKGRVTDERSLLELARFDEAIAAVNEAARAASKP